MLHKKRIWQISDWNLTVAQMVEIAKESDWNFCLCQGFHLTVKDREVYLLNDSIHPDPLHHYQEYAPVVVTRKQEITPGKWRCEGFQIESLTVNMAGGTPLADLIAHLGDQANDYGANKITFNLEAGDQHLCENCA
jgi:hypothetical protein